jgi:hypothetical protein
MQHHTLRDTYGAAAYAVTKQPKSAGIHGGKAVGRGSSLAASTSTTSATRSQYAAAFACPGVCPFFI